MQLKRYVSSEGSQLQPPSNQVKGYVCAYSTNSPEWWALLAAGIIALILLLASSFLVYSVFRDTSEQSKPKLSIFFSIGTVVVLFNVAEFGMCIYTTIFLWQKILVLMLAVLAALMATGILLLIPNFRDELSPSCPCRPHHKFETTKCSIPVNAFYLVNVFLFVNIQGFNIVPLFIMLLHAPIETFSVVLFCISAFGTFILVVAVLYHAAVEKKCKQTLVFSLYVTSILIITAVIIGVYLKILTVSTRAVNPSITLQLASLLPSILSIILGYFTNKKLFKSKSPVNNIESPPPSSDNNNGVQESENGVPSTKKKEATNSVYGSTEETPADERSTENASLLGSS